MVGRWGKNRVAAQPFTRSRTSSIRCARGRDRRRLPGRAPRAGESPVERVDGGGRGVLPGPASPASRVRPGNGRPGCWRATGGPPSVAAGARRAASDLAAVLATCHRTRRRGRGAESDDVALKRGRLDAVIAGLLFMAGMRRREVSALLWGDVAESAAGDGVLVTVRRGKNEPGGRGAGTLRFVKGGVAVALRIVIGAAMLRLAHPADDPRSLRRATGREPHRSAARGDDGGPERGDVQRDGAGSPRGGVHVAAARPRHAPSPMLTPAARPAARILRPSRRAMTELTLPQPARGFVGRQARRPSCGHGPRRRAAHPSPSRRRHRPRRPVGPPYQRRCRRRLPGPRDAGRPPAGRRPQTSSTHCGASPGSSTASGSRSPSRKGASTWRPSSPRPRSATRKRSSTGRPEMVLSSAQILSGKLERADRLQVRDVFDIVTATKTDPAALATAVSMRQPPAADAPRLEEHGQYPDVDDPRKTPLTADRATLRRAGRVVQPARLSAPAAPGRHRRAHRRSSAARASASRRSARPSASRRGPSRATSAASRREADDDVSGDIELTSRP